MRRSASRETVEALGSFRHPFQPTQHIRIADLTCTGCKIEGIPAGLFKGDRIAVGIEGLSPIHSTVQWVRAGLSAGLKFEQALHPAVFTNLLAKLRNEDCSTGYTPVSKAAPIRRC